MYEFKPIYSLFKDVTKMLQEDINVFNAVIQQLDLTFRPGVVVEHPEAFDCIGGLIFRFTEQTAKARLEFSNSYIHSCYNMFAVQCKVGTISFQLHSLEKCSTNINNINIIFLILRAIPHSIIISKFYKRFITEAKNFKYY